MGVYLYPFIAIPPAGGRLHGKQPIPVPNERPQDGDGDLNNSFTVQDLKH
jgi:hypothetical protein